MNLILLPGNVPALSYAFFGKHGIARKTVENFVRLKPGAAHYEGGKCFIIWPFISKPTQQKLPRKEVVVAEAMEEARTRSASEIEQRFYHAFFHNFLPRVPHFRNAHKLSIEKSTESAQYEQLWQEIINLTNEGCRKVKPMHDAYTAVAESKPLTFNTFNKNKGLAIRHGAEWMALDGRKDNSLPESHRVSVVNQYWADALISIGKKYNNRQVWEKMCEMCEEGGEKKPSLAWVKKYRKEALKNIVLYRSRQGNDKTTAKKQTHATMIHALHALTQLQIDGWTMPFWGPDFERYVMFIVMDAHSKKIVGFAIGPSENTILIMKALKNAFSSTNCLPGELLMDKHAFTKTKEAAYLKEEFEKRKLFFTVTTNPQWKSIVERQNQNLNTLCMDYFGYTGKNITAKGEDARPSQEVIDKHKANFLSEDEIMRIGCDVVVDYNRQVLPKYGKSPNEMFDASEQPKCYKLDMYERIQVLTIRTDATFRNGETTITRGGKKYYYQLTSEFFHRCNDATVHVRYEDLEECIYLYEMGTDEPIGCLPHTEKIHGAKPDQNERDIELLNKNKGRANGNEVKGGNKLVDKVADALKKNPEAVAIAGRKTMPKDVVKQAEKDAEKRQVMRDQGLDPDKYVPERESEITNPILKGENTKPKKSLFAPLKVPDTLQKVNPLDYLNED